MPMFDAVRRLGLVYAVVAFFDPAFTEDGSARAKTVRAADPAPLHLVLPPTGEAGAQAPQPARTEPPLHIVSVQTSDAQGGGEFANVDLLKAMRERGEHVRLVTNQPELADGTGVPVAPIDIGPKLGRRTVGEVATHFAPWRRELLAALRREAGREPIDVLLLHYKKEQFMGATLPPSVARSIVWAEWGPLPDQLQTGPGRLAYLAAARSASAIVAVSESTRQSLIEAGVPARKVVFVPTLVDPAKLSFDAAARAELRAEWGAGEGTFVVGIVSRLHEGKRIDVAIDAVSRMDGDVLLVISGDGPNEANLRRQAEAAGIAARFLPPSRGWVERLLSAVDVQVFAAQPSEGLPRAIMFGQLTERPVITTDASRVPGLIPPGTGAGVEPPNDPAALAALLDEYRRDPERRAREGAAGRRFALEHYDPTVAADRLAAIFRTAAARGRPTA